MKMFHIDKINYKLCICKIIKMQRQELMTSSIKICKKNMLKMKENIYIKENRKINKEKNIIQYYLYNYKNKREKKDYNN